MSAPTSDKAAIRAIIRELKRKGFTLDSVWDGEESTKVSTETEALDVIMSLDQAHLYINKDGVDAGWGFFVLGNEPEEVLNDSTEQFDNATDALVRSWW